MLFHVKNRFGWIFSERISTLKELCLKENIWEKGIFLELKLFSWDSNIQNTVYTFKGKKIQKPSPQKKQPHYKEIEY